MPKHATICRQLEYAHWVYDRQTVLFCSVLMLDLVFDDLDTEYYPSQDYKNTYDTIYTNFWGITDNTCSFGRPFLLLYFFAHPQPVHLYVYPSTLVFTCSNDGCTVLCIKLWLIGYIALLLIVTALILYITQVVDWVWWSCRLGVVKL